MKLYSSMKSMLVYSQSGVSVPKGDTAGYDNILFLLSPTKNTGYDILSSSFLNYRKGLYKYYYMDFIYKDKIGFKKYLKNNTGVFKKEFAERKFPYELTMVTNGNKVSVLKRKVNLLVNLGEWNDIYFQYQVKSSVEKICKNYINFLYSKINTDDFRDYNKIVYIDVDQWISTSKKIGIERKNLVNPISIILASLYKFPELFNGLVSCDILLVSPSMNKILKIENTDLIKKNYPKIKSRILSIINPNCIDNMDETTALDNPVPIQNTNNFDTTSNAEKDVRAKIISDLTRNLVGGKSNDVTQQFEDKPEPSETIETDDEKVKEIQNLANQYLDDHPELLTNTNTTVALKEVTDEVKDKIYIREFTPKHTAKQIENIKKLTDIQTNKIGSIDEEIKDLKSKTIEESDYSDIVTTTNTNLTQAKFVNFDRSYNEKKLQQDIDNSVGQLANAKIKVFVIDKQEEDTSTPMDLKKTLRYTLKDENGHIMRLKFDVPIIFDDHFMYLKGNKKVIQHMFVLNPLVKTGKDAVQFVSNYQKMFFMRKGSLDLKTDSLYNYINKNKNVFKVVNGNGVITNKKHKSTKEYNSFAKNIVQFEIGKNLFMLDPNKLFERMDKAHINYSKIDLENNVIIGIDTSTNKPISINTKESFVDKILSYLPEESIKSVKKLGSRLNASNRLSYTVSKPLNKEVPLVLLLCYWEGFKKVMEKAKIEYEILPKTEKKPDIDLYEWGLTELANGYIKWKRYPFENSMLMNGFNKLPTHLYTMDELESQDTYTFMLTHVYSFANQALNLDQYYDFMVDPITKEVLVDKGLPTDFIEICLLANKMLKTDEHTQESDLSNMRLRSNEVIAYHVYNAVTAAYRQFRTSQHKRTPDAVSIPQDAVIKALISSGKPSVINDASSLNPILEISKNRAVTYKGEAGFNGDHVKLDVRAYNDTMLGVMGITSSPDANIGINRQLTMEPNITSTRGYIDTIERKDVEELNSANLFTPAELLTPLGVQHDDPARTSMGWKQTMYSVLVDDSDSVLIGNGAEKVLPYHLSSEFTIIAEDDGEVVDKQGDLIVIKYKNGKYRTIDTSLKIKKNAAAGFFIESKLTCNKEIGDKVKKNEIVAWDNKGFKKKGDSPEVSMRLGPLVKIAIIPEWDIFEDSAPISRNASERMTTTMVMPVTVTLDKNTYVSKIVKVGDKVEAGDSVIVFDEFPDDPSVMDLLNSIREDAKEEVIESNASSKKTHYTGTISKIDVITSVPVEELSDSLKKIVNKHWKEIKSKDKLLSKYRNPGDCNYYKSGNLITESPTPVKTDNQGKIKGNKVGDGVIITFYVSFKDVMSRGDKLASQFALKSINSHVIERGYEPYSEFRPEEPIDLIVAPLSISARKTPSIFLGMFANKILIEAKRHLKDYWENN